MIHFLNAQPELKTTDVDRAITYYGVLGLEVGYRAGDEHVVLVRDGCVLHLSTFAEAPGACQVLVSGISELYRLASARLELHTALTREPWGNLDFVLRDPWQNLVTIAERAVPTSATAPTKAIPTPFDIQPVTAVADLDAIRAGLRAFADPFTGPRRSKPFGFAHKEAEKIIGGVTGTTVWDWLIVDHLWVDAEVRARGLGSALLERAEQWGISVGCLHARLNTFEFEAREFYEAHGYQVENQSDDFPAGHTQYHLTKRLA